MHRLYREIDKDLTGYIVRNTKENLLFLKLIGAVIQKDSNPEYFLFHTEFDVDDGPITLWTIDLTIDNINNLYYQSILGTKIILDIKKIITIEELQEMIKDNIYIYPIETTYMKKKLKEFNCDYRLKIKLDWLKNIVFLDKNEIKLKKKFCHEFISNVEDKIDETLKNRILKNLKEYL